MEVGAIIGERAYLGATLERVDELLGKADGCFAGGVLVIVQLRIQIFNSLGAIVLPKSGWQRRGIALWGRGIGQSYLCQT